MKVFSEHAQKHAHAYDRASCYAKGVFSLIFLLLTDQMTHFLSRKSSLRALSDHIQAIRVNSIFNLKIPVNCLCLPVSLPSLGVFSGTLNKSDNFENKLLELSPKTIRPCSGLFFDSNSKRALKIFGPDVGMV